MKELGKRLRRRRLELKMTLKEVAASVSKSHGWLVDLEKGLGNPKAEDLTGLAVKLHDDPKEYLRLAGRVSLAASDVTPLTRPPLPPGFEDAVAAAVKDQIAPLLKRIDDLLDRLPNPPEPPTEVLEDWKGAERRSAAVKAGNASLPRRPSRGRRNVDRSTTSRQGEVAG